MKRGLKIKVFLAAFMALVGASSAQAFNPGTHVFIVGQVFPFCLDKIDLYYGAIGPDLALYVPENLQAKWPQEAAFYDTHYEFIDFRDEAWGFVQQAFGKGWLSHNEINGADHYAHVCAPSGGCTQPQDGYVYRKARDLLEDLGGCIICPPITVPPEVNLELAHSAIEIAIDVLLKQYNDPKLAKKLVDATLLRSWRDLALLEKVLVLRGKATDALTLYSAEISFRNIVFQYAMALAFSSLENMGPLAVLGSQTTGGALSPEQVLPILQLAIDLCAPDYEQVIQETIQNMKSDLR